MPEIKRAKVLDVFRRPFAVVLGTGEIASAVAVYLHRAGFSTILSHDPFPPVIRRAMAFHDALFDDRAVLEGVEAERADDALGILRALARPDRVVVTPLGLVELMAIRSPRVLVDARMQKHRISHDLRVVPLAVGVGPHFHVGVNCDIAVETRPSRNGRVVTSGATSAPDGVASLLGGVGSERFVYSQRPGVWHTPLEIGLRVYKGMTLGFLGDQPIMAAMDGSLRGAARDGSSIPGGVKLVEIDPRGRHSQWTGIDDRSRSIALATLRAVHLKLGALPAPEAAVMRLPSRAIDSEV